MNDKKVDFDKIAKKVKANLKKAQKKVNKKTEKNLIKTVSILNGGQVKKTDKGKDSKNKLSSSKLINIIRSSIRTFRINVSNCLSQKKNKKLFDKRKKELKKEYDTIKKNIQSFVSSFEKNLKTLQEYENAFTKKVALLKNNETLKNLLKVIGNTIKKIKGEADEAKQALDSIKKLYKSVK